MPSATRAAGRPACLSLAYVRLILHASLEVGHVSLYVACMNRERKQTEKNRLLLNCERKT
jgi:hypothetical protein